MPAPGCPLTTTEDHPAITSRSSDAAPVDSEPLATSPSRSCRRVACRRIVADSASATGGMAADSRARPSSTRAWTIGLRVSSERVVGASSRSTTARFSSSLVGSARPCSRPVRSIHVTRAPSMNTSSTSGEVSTSVSGPNATTEASSRRAISAASRSRGSVPTAAPRW